MEHTEIIGATLSQHQQALYSLLQEFDRVCRKLNIPYLLFAGTMLGAVRHQGFIPWDDDLDVIMHRRDYARFLKDAPAVLNQERFFLQKEFSEHWPLFFSKLRLNGTTCLEKYHPRDAACHQGVYMDIFPLDNAAGSALGRKIQFFASKIVIAKGLYARGYDTDSRGKKLFMQLCRLLPGKLFWKLAVSGRENSPLLHSFFGAASDFGKNVYPRSWFDRSMELPFAGGSYPVPADYDLLLTHLYGDYRRIPTEAEREVKRHCILVDLNRSYEAYEGYREGMKFEIQQRSIR